MTQDAKFTPAGQGDSDEVSLGQIVRVIWRHRYLTAKLTFAFILAGALYAFLTPPLYYSQATIALKDTKSNQTSGLLSQFGGVGGLVASQLGNTNLEKMEVIVKSHDLAESVIGKNNLLPLLFPKKWDSERKEWKTGNSAKHLMLRKGIEKLRSEHLTVSVDAKKGILRLGVSAYSPRDAKRMTDLYLAELNNKIHVDAMQDAEGNRAYLEKQLYNTRDPILMETIQKMIGFEIEKYMLVSNRAFDLLERPVVPLYASKPKKKMVVVLAALLGFVFSSTIVLAWKGRDTFRKGKGPADGVT